MQLGVTHPHDFILPKENYNHWGHDHLFYWTVDENCIGFHLGNSVTCFTKRHSAVYKKVILLNSD